MAREEAAEFEKKITLYGSNERGLFTHVIDPNSPYLVKTAGQHHPTIAAYIRNAKTIPGITQILLTALGAGEYWGSNSNGDWFGESELAHEGPDYGFKTFETTAKVFKHHINKPDSPSYGTVALSVYNPKMHRVELIVHVNNDTGADIVSRVDRGETTEWSMGCRIPFDVCSVCGNRAPKREFYCYHLKLLMGSIDPDSGKQVYAINIRPRFFDISYVLIGADRIAKTLMKVASAKPHQVKHAEIEKEIPGDTPQSSAFDIEKLKALAETFMDLKAHEAAIPNPVLDRLSSGYDLSQILSTMTLMGILPKPEEFQRLYLHAEGEPELAEKLSSQRVCFDPSSAPAPTRQDFKKIGLDFRHFDGTIASQLTPFASERSCAANHLGTRLLNMVKNASSEVYTPPEYVKVGAEGERKPIPLWLLLGGAAAAYAALAGGGPSLAATGIDKALSSPGGAAAAAALGLTIAKVVSMSGGDRRVGQTRFSGPYENPDQSDVFARIEEMKARGHKKFGSVGAAGKRIFLGIPAAYMASGILQQNKRANPGMPEGQAKAFLRQNPDVVGSVLLADGLLSMRGKGTHGMLKNISKVAHPLTDSLKLASDLTGAEEFSKCAGAEDFISQAITWPLAIGKANLPGRIVGGLFDQAVMETAAQYKKRKEKKKTNN
jgi:hypothetical protein